MRLRAARFLVLAFAALLCACNTPPQNVAMGGNADGVIINYFGDVAQTLPLARQHCARYERVPVLHETSENHAVYFCVRAAAAPGAAA
jgi:hypothetical protein